MQAKITIGSQKRDYQFFVTFHHSSGPAEHQIEHEFYVSSSLSHSVPPGKHIECEVVSPALWEHPAADKIHLHKSTKNGKWYVCWTNPVPDVATAQRILELWCAGTVYTMEHGEKFDKLLVPEEHTGDYFPQTITRLSEELGIKVLSFLVQ